MFYKIDVHLQSLYRLQINNYKILVIFVPFLRMYILIT